MQKIFNWPGDFYYIRRLHWTVQGDIYNHQYQIHHFNQQIMKMDNATLFQEITMYWMSQMMKMLQFVFVLLRF